MASKETSNKTKQKKASTDSKETVKKSERAESKSEKAESFLREIYEKEPNTVKFGALGLVLSICFINLGFWPVILIILLTGAGFVYGQYKDKKLWVYKLLKKISKSLKWFNLKVEMSRR